MAKIDGIPASAAEAMLRLEEAGYEAYCVGGCVRDRLLGREPYDWDVCTSAAPNETMRVFSDMKTIPTGIKHGTVTVMAHGKPIEITTYRIDGEYTDGRHPDSVSFTRSLKEDLARRDFTVNAMAADARGNVFDYYGGENDLANKLLRAVGNAETRFTEDALRILRAVRFSSVLGFSLEQSTAEAAIKLRGTLGKVSRERICAEICKLLMGSHAAETLRLYSEVIAAAIPQLNTADIISAADIIDILPQDLPARLAALMRFSGSEIAEIALLSLRVSNEMRKKVLALVSSSALPLPTERAELKAVLLELLPVWDSALMLDGALYGAIHAKSADCAKQAILSSGECYSIKMLAVGGSELNKVCGIKGKQTGEILAALLSEVIAERLPNEKQALLSAARAMM